jgi:hypothetical protein
MDHSRLLMNAATVLRATAITKELQDLATQVLIDSNHTLGKLGHILWQLMPKPGKRQLATIIRWLQHRKRAHALLEELDSLKSTLGIMLQIY